MHILKNRIKRSIALHILCLCTSLSVSQFARLSVYMFLLSHMKRVNLFNINTIKQHPKLHGDLTFFLLLCPFMCSVRCNSLSLMLSFPFIFVSNQLRKLEKAVSVAYWCNYNKGVSMMYVCQHVCLSIHVYMYIKQKQYE